MDFQSDTDPAQPFDKHTAWIFCPTLTRHRPAGQSAHHNWTGRETVQFRHFLVSIVEAPRCWSNERNVVPDFHAFQALQSDSKRSSSKLKMSGVSDKRNFLKLIHVVFKAYDVEYRPLNTQEKHDRLTASNYACRAQKGL